MFIKNSKKWLLICSLIFYLSSYGDNIKNSDIRIEIISQIKIYREKVENLKKMLKMSDEKEKVLIEKHIKLIKEKIKKLQKILNKYEENISNTG